MLSMVARPVKPSEIATNPKAKVAVDEEWMKLRNIETWSEDTVCEYDDARAAVNKRSRSTLRTSILLVP